MTQPEWKAAYVSVFVEAGFSAKEATDVYEAGIDDHDFSGNPVDAATEEMSEWQDDGDAL